MANDFVGRRRELALLQKRLDRVASTRTGHALAIRGRRQVGKSRLVQEFCDTSNVPYMFYTAIKGASPAEAIADLLDELRRSGIAEEPDAILDHVRASWPDALRALAAVVPDSPVVLVFDELPWMSEQDDTFDGALQAAWDRLLSRRPVFLVLLGSDVHMMERLTSYDRPFFGRADDLVLEALDPVETGQALGLRAADAIDAHLVSGGLPGILRAWPHAMPALEFIRQECADPASALFGIPESVLLSEFPAPDQVRRVLEAVGSGDRTHANIAAAAGGRQGSIPSGSLSPLLRRMVTEKRVLATDPPLSTRPGKPALYRVADSNLRFYLGALRSAHELSRRGRPTQAFELVSRRWHSWRGRAVEPLIRQALERAAGAEMIPWPDVKAVGGWWNRQFDPEIDLVGADQRPVASTVRFVGSVKWLENAFGARDLTDLVHGAAQVPGYDPHSTALIAVSLSGITVRSDVLSLRWGPRDVIAAWEGSAEVSRNGVTEV